MVLLYALHRSLVSNPTLPPSRVMSSKRGRKRNDNLPPNRARDVQRAFRARRAAHLLALEHRVSELEVENARLRKMVGWPPDTRPPLGKGPTGKDRPKAFDGSGAQSDFFSSGHDSETDVADSSPPRTSSLSPTEITTTPSRQMQVIDESWDQALIMNEHQPDVPSSSESPYQLPPMAPIPAPIPSKALSYPSYASSLPSSSRSSMSSNNMQSSNVYLASPASYPHTGAGERSIHQYSSSSFGSTMRGGEMRDESPRQHYSYSQSQYQTHDPNMHSPPPPVPTPGHTTHQSTHRESPIPLGHRRALADTQAFTIGQGFPHLPNPTQSQQNMRPPDMHRLHPNDSHDQQTYRTIAYGPDGRINSLP